MQLHPERSPDTSVHGNHAPVTQVKIDLGAPTVAVVVMLVVVISACTLVMGLNLSKQARMDQDFRDMKTQGWLVERRLMDKEALDILHGDKLASDTEYGPTGNLQRMKPGANNGRK